MLPGERQRAEPMAARVCPEKVRSAHQSMNHLVAGSGECVAGGRRGKLAAGLPVVFAPGVDGSPKAM